MKFHPRIRSWLTAPLVIGSFLVIPVLPRFLIVRLARLLGSVAYRVSRREREVALANLALAFGETWSPEKREQIARQSLQSFALVMLDLFWFSCFTRHRLKRWVQVEDSLRELVMSPAPNICLSGHFGNWEVLGMTITAGGFSVSSVATPVPDRLVNYLLNRTRRGTGQTIVPRRGALRRLVKTLKNGGKIALLLDQNTLPREGGEFVTFFGLPVPVSKAGAALATRCSVPLAYCYSIADEKGRYTARGLPALWPDEPDGRKAELTQTLTTQFEELVRRHPEAWLWSYKRWKYIPDGHDGAGYPYYARAAAQPRATPQDENGR